MSLSLDSAKDAKAEVEDNNLRENEAGIPEEIAYDYEQHDAPIVRAHPECLISFDRIVGLSVFNTPDDFLDQQNNVELGGPQNYGNDLVLTVENPELVEGEIWTEESNDFRDFRVLGDPSDDFSPYGLDTEVIGDPSDPDGVEVNGVNLGMGGFEGDRTEEGFQSDYVQFFISSSRASGVLGQLDTAGKWAYDTDGNFTEGIMEVPPQMGSDGYEAETHGAPRAIGYPELRADMVDQQGAIAWTFGDDEPTQQSAVDVTIFTVEDGNLAACAPLSPEDEVYALPTYPRGGNLYYDHSEGETPEDVGADAEPENAGGVAEATEMIGSDNAEGTSANPSPAARTTDNDTDEAELAYGDLPDTAQGFVDDAVAAVEAQGYDSVEDFDDWDERFATGTADIEYDLDQARVTAIIDSRL